MALRARVFVSWTLVVLLLGACRFLYLTALDANTKAAEATSRTASFKAAARTLEELHTGRCPNAHAWAQDLERHLKDAGSSLEEIGITDVKQLRREAALKQAKRVLQTLDGFLSDPQRAIPPGMTATFIMTFHEILKNEDLAPKDANVNDAALAALQQKGDLRELGDVPWLRDHGNHFMDPDDWWNPGQTVI